MPSFRMSYRRVGPRQAARSAARAARRAASPRGQADRERMAHAAHPDQQHVRADEGDQDDGEKDDVPHQHLAEVHQVEERPDADRVEGVLAVGGDPLGVEVLLRQVAGERLDDRGHERHHAGDPGHRAPPPPGGHPELAPQVDDQERHEQLDAPQVQAVEEVANRVVVPPVRPAQGDGEPAGDHHTQRGQRGHAEDVYPGPHVGGLAVRQQLARRQDPQRPVAHPGRPHVVVWPRCPCGLGGCGPVSSVIGEVRVVRAAGSGAGRAPPPCPFSHVGRGSAGPRRR